MTDTASWPIVRLASRSPNDTRAAGVATAVAITIAYLIVQPASADFSSGDFRARLFRQGAYLWDNHWFGGHPLPGYGIVSPMLSGTLGVLPVAIGSLLVASWAFGSIVANCRLAHPTLPSPRLASALFAMGCGISLWGGRLTFGPAVAFAVLCVLCLQNQRLIVAVIMGVLCGLSSPVGALSLFIALASFWIAEAFPRRSVAIVAMATLTPSLLLNLFFAEKGWYPFTGGGFALLCVSLVVVGWFGRHHRVVLSLVVLYGLVAVGAFVVRSPLGGNVVRLGWLMAAPAAVLSIHKFRRTILPIFVAFAVIWGWSYVSLGFVPADASANPQYYDALADFVATQPAGQRVEVLADKSFRYADELALKINIARGWETQVDRELNPEFYGNLTADAYHAWLLRNSVSIVAVPEAEVLPIAQDERKIVEAGQSFLKLVWSSSSWRVYAVTDASPLADNGAAVTAIAAESLTIFAPKVGTTTIRFHYTKLYRVESGSACISSSPEGWIQLRVLQPGTVVLKVSLRAVAAATVSGTDPCS